MKSKILCVFVVLALMASLLIPAFGAWSTEETGLSLVWNTRNQNKFAQVGDYYIYATDDELLFYTSDGSLDKTYSNGVTTKYDGAIYAYNDSYVAWAFCVDPGSDEVTLYYLLIEVNSLTVSSSTVALSSGTTNADAWGVFILQNGYEDIYLIVSWYYDTNSYWRVYLWNSDNSLTNNGGGSNASIEYRLHSQGCFYEDATDPTKAVFVVHDAYFTTNRFNCFNLDLLTGALTYVGKSGLDNTFSSNYVYFFGYAYNETTEEHVLAVAYDTTDAGAESWAVQLCFFNSTNIDYDRITGSSSTPGDILRPLSVVYSGILTEDYLDLKDGSYRVIFTGPSGVIYQQSFAVLLDSGTYELNWDYDPVTYEGITHYYTAANNVGGLQVPIYPIMIQYDYQNGNAIATTTAALAAVWTYTWSLSPNATIDDTDPYNIIITINASTNYVYRGLLEASGVSDARGYYIRYLSYDGIDYYVQGSGSIVSSGITTTFSETAPEFFWRIVFNVTNYGGAVYTVNHHFLSEAASYFGGVTVPGVTGALDSGMAFIIAFLIPLLIIAAPAMILGAAVGMPGIFIGLLLSLGIGGASGILPLWGVIIIVFAMFVVLLLGGPSMARRYREGSGG